MSNFASGASAKSAIADLRKERIKLTGYLSGDGQDFNGMPRSPETSPDRACGITRHRAIEYARKPQR